MQEDNQVKNNKKLMSTKKKVVDTLIGLGVGFIFLILWGVFRSLATVGMFYLIKDDLMGEQMDLFMIFSILIFVIGLGIIIYAVWYTISVLKRKFIALGILIGTVGIPLLFVGGCFLMIFGLSGF